MTRLADFEALRSGDIIEVRDNGMFKSMGFEKISGTVEKISPNKEWFIIKCKETKSSQKIVFGDGYIYVESNDPIEPLKIRTIRNSLREYHSQIICTLEDALTNNEETLNIEIILRMIKKYSVRNWREAYGKALNYHYEKLSKVGHNPDLEWLKEDGNEDRVLLWVQRVINPGGEPQASYEDFYRK